MRKDNGGRNHFHQLRRQLPIKIHLFVLPVFHFPVGRIYSFSSSHDFFN